jgi:(S)-ureidoglycine aminohydrolase
MKMDYTYAVPAGGLPPQGDMVGRQAVFTDAYAFMPQEVMTDIVTSLFPGWHNSRGWIIARPLSGFAETFAQYIMEISPGGGSDAPEPDAGAQAVLFVVAGTFSLTIEGVVYELSEGGYAYIPPSATWSVHNSSDKTATFHWIRKRYVPVAGLPEPDVLVTSDAETEPTPMPDTPKWATSRFVDPTDLRHDMHVNIVTFHGKSMIPFPETHVMEHGLYVLEGTADYLLNTDWVGVKPGDFMWLRAFCPQACWVEEGRFRYLLYKDVNRHVDLTL